MDEILDQVILATSTDFLKHITLVEFFENQVKKTPQSVAATFQGTSITYLELNAKANQLAHKLRSLQTMPAKPVAILTDRSLETLIAIFAVLKAGGIYLPIDPLWPQNRVQYVFDTTEAKVLLHNRKASAYAGIHAINITDDSLYQGDTSNLESVISSNAIAYYIFTSGSTGKPKGVMVSHTNVINFLYAMQRLCPFQAEDAFLFKSNIAFDASIHELFGWIFNGGKLVIAPAGAEKDPEELAKIICTEKVTHLYFVPSLADVFFEYLLANPLADSSFIKHIFLGGEALLPSILAKAQALNLLELIRNTYGPTEATITASYFNLKDWQANSAVAIGKPLDNVNFIIVDEFNNVLPIGQAGELLIGGAGVVQGYLKDEEKTAAAFIQHPIFPDLRFYKTGDKACLQDDGNFYYLGRLDDQVKIRGYRIELGEIQNQLLQHEAIDAAVALVADAGLEKNISLFYILKRNKALTSSDVQAYLEESLPAYMVPTYITEVSQFPLTSVGKVDRKALLQKQLSQGLSAKTEIVIDNPEYAQKIKVIWAKVLGIAEDCFGINDSFFDLGGSSLTLIKIKIALQKELNLNVSLPLLYKNKTVAALVSVIDWQTINNYQKIIKANAKKEYVLSAAQQRIYFVSQIVKNQTQYNLPMAYHINGKVDFQRVQASFETIIKRHEILRTSFVMQNDVPMQIINEFVNFNVTFEKVEEVNLAKIINNFVMPFVLEEAPLLRAKIIESLNDGTYLLLDIHHIAADAVSINILLAEFDALYNRKQLPAVQYQYKDFIVWEHDNQQAQAKEKHKQYWLEQYKTEVPIISLPYDFPRSADVKFSGAYLSFNIDKEQTAALEAYAKGNDTSVYIVLLAAYYIFLSKCSGQEDVITGTPVEGRLAEEFSNTIGMFINTLALRAYPEPQKSFSQFLSEVATVTINALENQLYPFDELVADLKLTRDGSQNPLFNNMFSYQNDKPSILLLDGSVAQPLDITNSASKFDLSLHVSHQAAGMQFLFEYCDVLFKESTIARFKDYYTAILQKILSVSHLMLAEIHILPEEEKHIILNDFNATEVNDADDKNIIQYIDFNTAKYPHKIAFKDENATLTYAELQTASVSLAYEMQQQGIVPGDYVAVYQKRSVAFLISIVAIWRLGCIYVPLDEKHPLSRNIGIVKDTPCSHLLTTNDFKDNALIEIFITNTIFVDEYIKLVAQIEDIPTASIKDKNTAYVIFTSGSTGKPKGVMVNHAGMINHIKSKIELMDLDENSVIVQNASQCFDISIWQFFTTLITGGTTHIYSDELILNPSEFIKSVTDDKVTILEVVPSYLHLLLNNFRHLINWQSLIYLIVTGEELKTALVNEWYENFPRIAMVNAYGPTETSDDITHYIVDPKIKYNLIPIGKPIRNTKILILDNNLKLQPIGIAGELFVSGICLANGYVNSPELTNKSFIDNPFAAGTKLYRTGDLGRWLTDGNIEFLGRVDHQVKIRGHRIELAEIEACALKCKSLSNVLVLALEEPGATEKYLCCYYVEEKPIDLETIKAYLRNNLPEYMVPTAFVKLAEFPLTSNGKIDRKALPKPFKAEESERTFVAARNELDHKLISIWSKILHLERIGILDNFFLLGGQSLKAITLSSLVRKELKVELPIQVIFRLPTILHLSDYIATSLTEKTAQKAIVAEKRSFYPLSSSQKQLYFLNKFDSQNITYNIPLFFNISGELNVKKLSNVLEAIVARHASLRTYFSINNNVPVQIVLDKPPFTVNYIEKTANTSELIEYFVRPFDLSTAPLFRAEIVKLNKNEHVLMLDFHHIIADGISINLLLEEIGELYQGKEIKPLALQFKDFSLWQEASENNAAQPHLDYWINKFSSIPVPIELPTDFPRTINRTSSGAVYKFEIDASLTKALTQLSGEKAVTLFMLLIASFFVLLRKYSGQKQIVIGTPIAGRNSDELSNIVGMFVNTLVLKESIDDDESFTALLEKVKFTTLDAFEHRDFPLKNLVDSLKIPRDLSRNPLFDVMFILQNHEIKTLKLNDLVISDLQYKSTTVKFDLTLCAQETANNLEFYFEYSTDLFQEDSIKRFANHYANLLNCIAYNPTIKVKDIDIISQQEKSQILDELAFGGELCKSNQTLASIFQSQVIASPDNIAAMFNSGVVLTYQSLNANVNNIANQLLQKGLKAETIVGILVKSPLEKLISILAVIKAGGAYLPLDSAYPKERLEYMLEDSQVKLILTDLSTDIDLKNIDTIDVSQHKLGNLASTEITDTVFPHHLAYIIYTSGSTGKPKGVMIEQHSIVSRLQWMQNKFQLSQHDRILQKTSFSFDVSVWELFLWQLVGAAVCFMEPGDEKVPELIVAAIHKYKITIIHFVPSMLVAFLDYVKAKNCQEKLVSLRIVFVSGEELKPATAKNFYTVLGGSKVVLENLYGPTEASIDVTHFSCDKNHKGVMPIGKPIQNARLYVLDEYQQPVPINVKGEICISGSLLARGYINAPALTDQKFIPNPFIPSERLYLTGDVGRWKTDGNIEYLGRNDFQIKIRGVRIEIGEIENLILSIPGINLAVVKVENTSSEIDRYLVCYFTSAKEINSEEIRTFLANYLPDAMVPSFFVRIEVMPLNNNGKIDRKRLPAIPMQLNTTSNPPRNDIDKKLLELYRIVLKNNTLDDINKSFFYLGGNSLNAISLSLNVESEFDIQLPIKQIFLTPTIKGLADFIINEATAYKAIDIPKASTKNYYELSSSQARIYFLNSFENIGTTYNISRIFKITGELNKDKLEQALVDLVQRHESLRMTYHNIKGKPLQKISNGKMFKLQLANANEIDALNTLNSYISPFDLNVDLPFRACLLEIDKNKFLLLLDFNHIAVDLHSMFILFDDLSRLYEDKKLEDSLLQYTDFADWQNSETYKQIYMADKDYWLNTLQDLPAVLELPTDYPRPLQKSFEGSTFKFEINSELMSAINNICFANNVTLYMLLLTVFKILLARYSGQYDIAVGTPVLGRNVKSLEKVVGMFVNTLVLRTKLDFEKSFLEVVKEVKNICIDAFDHASYPYENIVAELKANRDPSRNPLFDIMFLLNTTSEKQLSITGLEVTELDYEIQNSKMDITLAASILEDKISLTLEYWTKLFSDQTIKQFAEHYLIILNSIVNDANVLLKNINIISENELTTLAIFNNTQKSYPVAFTLRDIFKNQVATTPTNKAIFSKHESLTYEELDKKALALAAVLQAKGVKPDTIVALLLSKPIEKLIGIIAVHKAGGGYLPIDCLAPVERIRYVIKDSKAVVVLTDTDFNMEYGNAELINITNLRSDDVKQQFINPVIKPNHLAYVIYTSGSTGQPKGVMVEHGAIVNRLYWMQDAYPLTSQDILIQKTPYTFDVSVWELFWWQQVGASVYILEQGEEKDPAIIAEIIHKNNITVIHFVPSMFQYFLSYVKQAGNADSLKSLRQIFTSGEELTKKQVDMMFDLFPEAIKLDNLYGPTEAAVDVTYYTCSPLSPSRIPIGKPIANTQILILNEYRQMQPLNVPGEICIAGVCLARGYLAQEELTNSKFIDNPFSAGDKLYRTGDTGHWLADGNIQYIGRIDNQVKLRGNRIELGEIEHQVLKIEGINAAVVVIKLTKDNEKFLACYYNSTYKIESSQIREHLKNAVPEYMIPSYFIFVEEFTLTTSGKVDRKALPEIDINAFLNREISAVPMTEKESLIQTVWANILEIPKNKIDIYSNFFELGGNSLKAIQIKYLIEKQLKVKTSIRDFLDFPTINEFANRIVELSKIQILVDKAKPIVKMPMQDHYPLSNSQQRFWFIDQMIDGDTSYMIPIGMYLHGNIDFEKITAAWTDIVKRHEAFRMVFIEVDGGPKLEILSSNQATIQYITHGVDKAEIQKVIEQDQAKSFVLSSGPAYRIILFACSENKYYFYLNMHHIISDGVSVGIIIKDFINSLDNLATDKKNVIAKNEFDYLDFIHLEQSEVHDFKFQEERKLLLKNLSKPLPELNLPYDFERFEVQTFAGDQVDFSFDNELIKQIRTVEKAYNASQFMVLFTAYFILMKKLTNQNDIIIGFPVSGRTRGEFDKVVGLFINTLVIRIDFKNIKSFAELLLEVKEKSILAIENQDVPFDLLIKDINPERKLNRSPIFDTMFALQNYSLGVDTTTIKCEFDEVRLKTSKFDLSLTAYEINERLQFSFTYNTDLFKRVTVQRFVQIYSVILKHFLEELSSKPTANAVLETA